MKLNGRRLMKDDSRRLGVFVPQALPENWRSGIISRDNLFNGMVLPNKTEIVDRWLAADGSHNVVINTPSGQTFCGRALAWDPMQPVGRARHAVPSLRWRRKAYF